MSVPALGLSGTSLALGIFNSTQIASLKSQIEELFPSGIVPGNKIDLTTSVEQDIPVEAPKIQKTIEVDEVEPLEETTFSQAESGEVSELQDKIVDLERFANQVNTRSVQNTNNVTIKGDELDRLSSFVTDALIAIRERTSSAENSITEHSSTLELHFSGIQENNSEILAVDERLNIVRTDLSDLSNATTGLQQRMDASESNAVELSAQISDAVLNIDSLGDNISLLDDILVDTKEALEVLTDSWNGFNSVAFVGDGKLQVSTLQAEGCNIAFNHGKADESALHWTSNLNDSGWVSYLGKTDSVGPDGLEPKSFGVVTDWAIRTRIGTSSNQGFILENNSGNGVFSVSSRGVLEVGSHSRISDLFSNAYFGHGDQYGVEGFCVIQNASGKTQINSAADQDLNLCQGGTPYVTLSDGGLNVLNPSGTNITHFNYKNTGNNFIRSSEATHFSFGTASPTVSVTTGEITANGKELRSSIVALEARVTALEKKQFILNGDDVRIRNENNDRFLRKSSSNNSAIMDSTTRDSRSQWTISHA